MCLICGRRCQDGIRDNTTHCYSLLSLAIKLKVLCQSFFFSQTLTDGTVQLQLSLGPSRAILWRAPLHFKPSLGISLAIAKLHVHGNCVYTRRSINITRALPLLHLPIKVKFLRVSRRERYSTPEGGGWKQKFADRIALDVHMKSPSQEFVGVFRHLIRSGQ